MLQDGEIIGKEANQTLVDNTFHDSIKEKVQRVNEQL